MASDDITAGFLLGFGIWFESYSEPTPR